MNASLRFYCETLEFRIHQSAGEKDDIGWVWLKWGSVDLMLNTAFESPYRPEHPDSARLSAHNDTILYVGCPDIDGAYKELQQKGFEPEKPSVAPYGMKQMYFRDPDGYGICFQWPTT